MSELGRWLGVSYQAIQHYEKVGAHMPVAMALAAIEKGLQPDIDYEATGITRMAALAIVAQKNGLQPWQPGRNNMNQNEK